MTFDERAFGKEFKVPVLWRKCTSVGNDGAKALDPARTVMSRLDPKGARPEGFQDNVSGRMLLMKPYDTEGVSVMMTTADEIALPAGQPEPLDPAIKAVDPFYDEKNELHHWEVSIGGGSR